MIIGITGNYEKEKIYSFMEKYYLFDYIDVDEILKKIVLKNIYKKGVKKDNWKNNQTLLLKIKNEIDQELWKRINGLGKEKTIVVDYSVLECSSIFDDCNLIIKVYSDNTYIATNEMELLKKYKKSSNESNYSKSKYHLELELSNDWENKLRDFINFNLFGTKKITVIVPVYNVADYLGRCVNSIRNQTYRNLEIVLIDDGSTDESLEMCKLLAEQDDRIKVVHQKNKGLAETRNKGIELATGEYISFIDSDDYIDNSMFETLLKEIEKTGADVCEGSFYIHLKNGNIKDVSCEQKGMRYVSGKMNLINAYSDATILIPAWDKLYRLSSIKKIKFDKNCFKEDADYIYRLCIEGKTFSLVPVPFYHYVKRKKVSITGEKISTKLFTLQKWGEEAYNQVLSYGEEYRDAAEKILYNSLVHILRNFMRDYKELLLENGEFDEEIHDVVSRLINLLLKAKNVKKFRKLDEVLEILNELIARDVLKKDKLPTIEIPCVGILWNSLNEEMMNEAVKLISEKSVIYNCVEIDLKEKYRQFIEDIYVHNHEFEGIPVIKASTLIDKYDSNTIMILNLVIKVSNYIYFNKQKGYMLEEIAELKSFIRKYFKQKIKDYAYDNIFHLTVDDDEYEYTDKICKKYIKDYKREGTNNDHQ